MEVMLEVVLRFAVTAENEEVAIEIVKEGMATKMDDLADIYCFEWCNPTIYTDK